MDKGRILSIPVKSRDAVETQQSESRRGALLALMLMIGLGNAQVCCGIILKALTVVSQKTVVHVVGALVKVKGVATEKVHVHNVR